MGRQVFQTGWDAELHNYGFNVCQTFLDSKWCWKIEKVEIWRDREGPEWFSGPNIIEILQHFCSNLLNFDHQRFLCSGHTHILVYTYSQKISSECLKTKIKNLSLITLLQNVIIH